VFINVLPIQGLNQTYGGANGVSLGEEISFSVYNDTKPLAEATTGSRRLESEESKAVKSFFGNKGNKVDANSTTPANATEPV